MKYRISTLAQTILLVIFAGVLFPIIFSVTDRLLRTIFSELNATLLTVASFSWLLIFYYFGIKLSVGYIVKEFEITQEKRLFAYSNLGFSVMSLLFYVSLLSYSWLSNLVWGSFYLITIGMFYWISSKELLDNKNL